MTVGEISYFVGPEKTGRIKGLLRAIEVAAVHTEADRMAFLHRETCTIVSNGVCTCVPRMVLTPYGHRGDVWLADGPYEEAS